jgi:hypothetical protein
MAIPRHHEATRLSPLCGADRKTLLSLSLTGFDRSRRLLLSPTSRGYDTFGFVGRGNAMSVIDPHTDVGKYPPPWDEYWTFGWLFLVQLLYWILAVVFKVD